MQCLLCIGACLNILLVCANFSLKIPKKQTYGVLGWLLHDTTGIHLEAESVVNTHSQSAL